MKKRDRPKDRPLEVKRFSTEEEIDRAIARFQERIQEVQDLCSCNVEAVSQEVANVEYGIRSTILQVFGENSPEYREYRYHEIWKGSHAGNDTASDAQGRIKLGTPDTIAMLEGLIDQLLEEREGLSIADADHEVQPKPARWGEKIFIVHGRNKGAKANVARFLDKLGLETIVLHEKASQSRTIIEKLEHHTARVAYAVVLLTGDDQGGLRGGAVKHQNPRAPQNVILELGLFIAKLGRKRVCCLYEEGLELPSDLQGVLYVPFDPNGAWKLRLAKELKAAGLDVDLSKVV